MSTAAVIIITAVIVAAVVIGLYFYNKQQRTRRLRTRFGPEYDRTAGQLRDEAKVEAELERREKRVERFRLRTLSAADQQRYTNEWQQVQAEFVDDPQLAVTKADRLLQTVMTARGYPASDFETTCGDLSVHHPRSVQNYRSAHDIILRHKQGNASTEDLRQSMVLYRALFEDLLDRRKPDLLETPAPRRVA